MNIPVAVSVSRLDRLVRLCRRPDFHLLFLAVIGAALYFYTLHYPFVFDDRILLLQNPLIKNSSGFLDLFDYDNFVPKYLPRLNDPDMVSSFALRPVAYITFRVNYLLGGMNPAGFRAVNIVIHITNAAMLYLLLRGLIKQRGGRQETDAVRAIPLCAALLFLVHPLQTESVTYITQRFTSLGTSFYLATMLLYLTSVMAKPRYSKQLLYLASLAVLIIGMLTKEFVFTAPVSLVLMSLILMRKPLWASLRRLAPHLLCLGIVPTLVMFVSEDLSGKSFSIGSAASIMNSYGYSRWEYAITQLRVILSYFRMLVLPYGQNFDPDYPLFKTVSNPEILVSVMIWGVVIATILILLRKTMRSIADDLVLFSLIWFPVLLSISSTVIPLPDLISEHRTYLPSLAFCTGMAAYVHSLRCRVTPVWRQRIALGFCLLIACFSLLTVQRNFMYSSRLALWSDTASKSPMKARPALALGNIYLEMQQIDESIAWMSKAIALNPHYLEAYLSLGSLFQDLSMSQNAIDLYESYLISHAPEPRLLSNLAMAYSESGNPQQTITTLEMAIELDPDDERLKIIIAEHLFMLGKSHEAQNYLAAAKDLDQANPLVDYSNLIKMMEKNYRGNPAIGEAHVGKIAS